MGLPYGRLTPMVACIVALVALYSNSEGGEIQSYPYAIHTPYIVILVAHSGNAFEIKCHILHGKDAFLMINTYITLSNHYLILMSILFLVW